MRRLERNWGKYYKKYMTMSFCLTLGAVPENPADRLSSFSLQKHFAPFIPAFSIAWTSIFLDV